MHGAIAPLILSISLASIDIFTAEPEIQVLPSQAFHMQQHIVNRIPPLTTVHARLGIGGQRLANKSPGVGVAVRLVRCVDS